MVLSRKEIKRVVLTYPNQKWKKHDFNTTRILPPYAICILATMIKEDYEVRIVDANLYNMSKEQFQEEIREFKPQVVGISVLTSEYGSTLDDTASYVKEIDREIITIAGGVHVTTQYMDVIKNVDIDYAIRGEGEYVLRDLLKYINGKGGLPGKGLVYRNNEGKTIALSPELIQDLDALPFPDYDLVDYKAYSTQEAGTGIDLVHVYPYSRIISSRGCPIGCSFCQVEEISGKRPRMRSAAKVVEELEIHKKKHGIKGFLFDDDMPFGSKKRTKEMLRLMIDKKLNLVWKAAGVAIFKMDEEIFRLMAESGCQSINIAIESGSERILKQVIKKPVDLKKVPEMIKIAKSYGLGTVANFVIGFPGETWEEIRQTLYYAETCGVDYAKIYVAEPLLGTELYDQAVAMNAIVGDHSEVGWRYGRIKTDEFDPHELSLLRVYEWDRINFRDSEKRKKAAMLMGISEEKLSRVRKETRRQLALAMSEEGLKQAL
jgi:radical SAM superfamily enzyme YgiQ (UPF0313 family)|tara:strand:- start:253 stop:1719 length:1467 start_codon:yes stop_codon:yes gene_type:complete